MSSDPVTLRQIDERDISYVEGLLARNDLPASDVRSKVDCFSVATARGERVGAGGLELYDTAGLLRSLAVEQSERGNGYGTAICDALETEAREAGVDTLYLLTTTATDFFAAREYAVIEREAAPAAIRRTTEFADLCPSTATCMTKSL